MKVGIITVPFITSDKHAELMRASYQTFKSRNHELKYYTIVNRCNPIYRDEVLAQDAMIVINKENCLARAWNIGLQLAMWDKCEIYFIPNLDVSVDTDALDTAIQEIIKDPCALYSLNCTNGAQPVWDGDRVEMNHITIFDNFSCFFLTPHVLKLLAAKELIEGKEPCPGLFDENIKPAYGEDVDYQYRLQRAGLKHYCLKNAGFIHYRNGTIKHHTDASELAKMSEAATTPYLTEKWGGIRSAMTKNLPFS